MSFQLWDQLEILDKELNLQGYYTSNNRGIRKTIHHYELVRKWDKIGLTCTNGKLAVLCAGKNNCPPNMEWRCGGWRKVFNMKYYCVLRICMKFILEHQPVPS